MMFNIQMSVLHEFMKKQGQAHCPTVHGTSKEQC